MLNLLLLSGKGARFKDKSKSIPKPFTFIKKIKKRCLTCLLKMLKKLEKPILLLLIIQVHSILLKKY